MSAVEATPAEPEIVLGAFRDPESERRFLAQRERALRRQLLVVHIGVALSVCAGTMLDFSRLSGPSLSLVLACRAAMVAVLLGAAVWAPGQPVERLGSLMLVALAVAYVGFGVIASTFLRATGRADYVLMLGGSAALLLPAQIAPAGRSWLLAAICVAVAVAIGSAGALSPADVAWNAFTVANLAVLGLLLNYLWNSSTRATFLAQERAVRAEAELRQRNEADARAARLALERREDEWEAILRVAPVAINIIDDARHVTFANGAARELGLLPGEDFVGRLCGGDGRLHPENPFSRVFEAGQVVRFDCTVGREPEERTFSFSAAPIGDAPPHESAVVIGLDRTEAHRLQQELHQAQKLRTVGSLAGSIAHDFNNLLTVISSVAELLSHEPLSEEGEGLLEELHMTTSHAARLTRQLLIFSRRQPVSPRSLDLSAVVREELPLLQRVLGPESTIRLELEENLAPVLLDVTHAEQILLNLTVNARDAMPRGGELVVTTRTAPGGVELRVRDTGPGIAAAALDRIFEPFFTTKSGGEGSGLGLTTVKSVVESCGGRIVAGNAAGGGAEIVILLPEERVPVAPSDEDTPPSRASHEILFVDDSENVLRLAVKMLERAGHRVHQARSLEEARLVIDAVERLDAVVSDVRLKGARGTAVHDAARARFSDIAVVYVSGYVDDGEILRRVESGEAALLDKPFTARALVEAVQRAVGRSPRPPDDGVLES